VANVSSGLSLNPPKKLKKKLINYEYIRNIREILPNYTVSHLRDTTVRTSNPAYSYRGKLKISIVGGGFQLGPLGTAVTNRPIVPAPGDYDDGEIGGITGRGN
jgi:hypothetical protein